jgi:rhamnosyltransferase
VRAQILPAGTELELLVCDSGSRDGSVEIARAHAATVLEIPPEAFSHGPTRNLLMERAHGEHVAFLTQDSVPANADWLAALLHGFALADDIALSFGPYLPAAGASPSVARELQAWFEGFAPDRAPRVDRLAPDETTLPARALLGRRGYFTDANGAIRRAAWERVRFREIAYAEDHALAHDMLRAGFAKAYVPAAGVLHSHEYRFPERLRRSFDEARALREVYGYVEPAAPRTVALKLWGLLGADRRWARAHGARWHPGASLLHHVANLGGALLGTRAPRLPRIARGGLSLEGRD